MLDTFKELLAHQLEAALCTLGTCIDRCPDASWNAPVGNHPFCRVAFHTLFYTDFYLGRDAAAFRRQSFHRVNAPFFGVYEELEDREPVSLYEKHAVKRYLQHCRTKAAEAIAAETVESLRGGSGFERRNFSRAELYVYNIRHVQHHSAQLSLRLRIDVQESISWIGSGWRER